jgi:dienelactone hydrolase
MRACPTGRRVRLRGRAAALVCCILACCAGLLAAPAPASHAEPPLSGAPSPSSLAPPQQVRFALPGAATDGPMLTGYLRLPPGVARSPGAILLHGCGGRAAMLDQSWGARLQDWGYTALTVDSFRPRGIRTACSGSVPPRQLDGYAALAFLAGQPNVQADRIAVIGFSQGGIAALMDVERGGIAQRFTDRFRAAIAFYPSCDQSGAFTVPTLVINGDRDDWSRVAGCRRMVAQESDVGIARTKAPSAPVRLLVIPGAFHDFDEEANGAGHRYFGHWLAYDTAGTEQAAAAVRGFLAETLAR